MSVKSPGALVPLDGLPLLQGSQGPGKLCRHFPRRGQQLLKPLDRNPEPRREAVPSLEITANPSACTPVRFGMSA